MRIERPRGLARGRPGRSRFAVSDRGGELVEHTTLLGAMKDASTRIRSGRRGVMVEDLARGVVWRVGRTRCRPPDPTKSIDDTHPSPQEETNP